MTDKEPIVKNGIKISLDHVLVEIDGNPMKDKDGDIDLRKYLPLACSRNTSEADSIAVFALGLMIRQSSDKEIVLDAANLEMIKRIVKEDVIGRDGNGMPVPTGAVVKGQVLQILEGKS